MTIVPRQPVIKVDEKRPSGGVGGISRSAILNATGGHRTILSTSIDSSDQGTWVEDVTVPQALGFITRNTSDTDGDNLKYLDVLATGTYTLCILGRKTNKGALVDIKFNADVVANFDSYNAVATNNFRFIQTDIVVSQAGLKTIEVKINGQNPSSGGFMFEFNNIAIWRTA